ncbi:hypothetical protein Slala03_23260 [Streptomyces lavendulae subsp. lavendulae]|nr:hypothetical protein Slala03_23260 [Streptomyces lavendulae subsp. lavendulae]
MLHEQAADAPHEVAVGVQVLRVGGPHLVGGVLEQGQRPEPDIAVRDVRHLRVAEEYRADSRRPAPSFVLGVPAHLVNRHIGHGASPLNGRQVAADGPAATAPTISIKLE